MNRSFRRLLTGSLLGVLASVVFGIGKKRRHKMRRKNLYEKAGHPIRFAIGQISKIGSLGKLLPIRRRLR